MLQTIQVDEIFNRIGVNDTNFYSMARGMNLPVYFSFIPQQPGVYLAFEEQGEMIYIGKASNLKKEITMHLSESGKNEILKAKTEWVLYFVLDSAETAALVEAALQRYYKQVNGILPLANSREERKPLQRFGLLGFSPANYQYKRIA